MTIPRSLIMLVPSRGRPESVRQTIDAFHATRTGLRTFMAIAVDDDDPEFEAYEQLGQYPVGFGHGPSSSMNAALNAIATSAAFGYEVIGFMGDDHRPRTSGWDDRVLDELESMGGLGIVYGDDLYRGAALPTAVFMTSNIIQALGYMAPPCLKHMFLDDYWLALGRALGRIRYLDDVVIEHLHPDVNKAEVDEGYSRVWQYMEPDRVAYFDYHTSGNFESDVEKVRAIEAVP